jgi:hypothetical protein
MISNEIPPEDPKYHLLGSHVIHEEGKPIIQSSLWNCIRRIREMEKEMTRSHEHSDLTIMPAPIGFRGKFKSVPLQPMKHEKEI